VRIRPDGAIVCAMRCFWLLLVLWGCSGAETDLPTEDPCQGGDTPTLTVGTGDSAYESTTAGQALDLVRGAQGGVHLTLAVDATYLNPEERLEATLTGLIGGQPVGLSEPFVSLRCNPDTNTLQAWGLRLIYDEQPDLLDGQATDVTVELTDVDGRVATGSTNFLINDPEAP